MPPMCVQELRAVLSPPLVFGHPPYMLLSLLSIPFRTAIGFLLPVIQLRVF